jgi:peptidyl-prolyl cis-trans isomerase SurA
MRVDMNRFARLIWVLVMLLTITGVQAQKSLDKKILLTVGDEQVTVKELVDVYKKNNVNNEMIDKKSFEEYVDLYTNFRLKVLEAEQLKMDTSKAFQKELSGYREQLAKPYFTDDKVSEELLLEAYNRKLKDVRANHILIKVNKDATAADSLIAFNKINDLRNRILKGEDFGKVAMESSDDPSARDRDAVPNQSPFRPGNKGDLGYFSVFDMVYPFENAAYNTPIGEISKPVRTDFGYHIIKVTEKSDAVGIIEVAHIYVAMTPGSDSAILVEKKDKIDNIHKKIEEGMSFEEAVRQFSEDRGSASRDGKLSKFTSSRIVPEFVQAVKTMQVGQVTDPIQTMYGFHIIKLISVEKPGTFDEEKEKLKERLAKDVRSKKSEEAVIQKIKKESKFKETKASLVAFIAGLDTTLTEGKFNATSLRASRNTLFTLGKEVYTDGQFASYISKNQSKQEKITPEVYAYKLYDGFVTENCLAYEDSKLETKYPEFASLMQEYRDGILLFDLTDQKVWSKAVKDSTGLVAFHEANKANYVWAERADATVFTVTNPDDAAAVKTILSTLNDDAAIVEKFRTDSIQSVRIQTGKFEKGDNNYVDMTEWKTGLSGELNSTVDKNIVFVNVKAILPPQEKALAEAKGIITSDYQTYLEKQWIEELRSKYPVTVNQEILEKVKAKY